MIEVPTPLNDLHFDKLNDPSWRFLLTLGKPLRMHKYALIFCFCCSLLALAQSAPIPTNSILVIGQSGCPACQESLPSLGFYSPKWEARGWTVRYYSLDSTVQDYRDYPVSVTPLLQRWEDPLIQQLGTKLRQLFTGPMPKAK